MQSLLAYTTFGGYGVEAQSTPLVRARSIWGSLGNSGFMARTVQSFAYYLGCGYQQLLQFAHLSLTTVGFAIAQFLNEWTRVLLKRITDVWLHGGSRSWQAVQASGLTF